MRACYSFAIVVGLLIPSACGDNGSHDLPPFDVRLKEVIGSAAGLSSPIDLQTPAGDSRLFIAELPGRLRIVQGGALLPIPFLDISTRVFRDGEGGLLSFAFDPQFPTNGFVFVHFIEQVTGNNGNIVVERYRVSSTDPNRLAPSSAALVIRIPHGTFSNHYGGRVAFGPDGMLYLSTGDGGGGVDPLMNGQNTTSLLGKLLRLNVGTLPYVVPNDNPTWPGTTQPSEIWAIGLRNPFRYAFDSSTGELYIADVGQNEFEEIDVVPANAAGINYGWNIMEATHCCCIGATFPGTCNMAGLTLPIHEYDHSNGDCAIVGGYVYRGATLPELEGSYLFSDNCSGWLRSLLILNGSVNVRQAPMVSVGNTLSFGQDGFGELYMLTADNRVLKVVR
jgi:hypothetical protein